MRLFIDQGSYEARSSSRVVLVIHKGSERPLTSQSGERRRSYRVQPDDITAALPYPIIPCTSEVFFIFDMRWEGVMKSNFNDKRIKILREGVTWQVITWLCRQLLSGCFLFWGSVTSCLFGVLFFFLPATCSRVQLSHRVAKRRRRLKTDDDSSLTGVSSFSTLKLLFFIIAVERIHLFGSRDYY